MRRLEIENLQKILIKPATRNSHVKIYSSPDPITQTIKELIDVEEFSLHFDKNWSWALLWIWVTDENGDLVLLVDEKKPFGPKRIKSLKKRVSFSFLENS